MDQQAAIIERISAILAASDEFYVPIKHIWKTLVMEGHPINLENLTAQLKDQPQFKLLERENSEEAETSETPGEASTWEQEMQYNMEALGYYDGERVSLVSRQPSADDLKKLIHKHLSNMTEALGKASAACPTGDGETQQKLKDLMERAETIRQSLSNLIDPGEDA